MDGPAATPEATPPRPRKRRIWRLCFLLFVLVVAMVLAAPYAANLPGVRRKVAAALAEKLAAPVRIDQLTASWFSGIEIAGVEIGNADGFDSSHPFLSLGSLRGDLSILKLIGGRIDVHGTVSRLVICIDQDAAGATNLERLFDHHRRAGGGGDGGRRVSLDGDLASADLRCDLELADAIVEIRRAGQLVESLHELDCRVEKEFGDGPFRIKLDARLSPTTASAKEGALHLRTDFDAATMVADADLETTGLDLARYQPLAQGLLPPGAITALQGVVNGTLTARVRGDAQEVTVDGDLTIDQPRIAGELVAGMDVRAARWQLHSALHYRAATDVRPPRHNVAALQFDLGFLSASALPAAELAAWLEGAPGVGCTFVLDLDALAAFGGPMPGWLGGSRGRLSGRVALPLPAESLLPGSGTSGSWPSPQTLLQQLRLDSRLEATRVAGGGFELAALDSAVTVAGGKLSVQTGGSTLLNQGPLQLQLATDLADLDLLPARVTLGWKGGKVAGETAAALRYVVPMLAGADVADFAAGIDLELALQGPSRRRPGENWLQLLDHWSGQGQLDLRDGVVKPAAALQGLLAPLGELLGPKAKLGDGGRLLLDQVSSPFTMREGAIESKAMKWLAKGREYGLSGRVRLDGTLDYGLDLTPLLAEHRDGARIVKALGSGKILAGLKGSLDKPALALPNAATLLQGSTEELLKKGLEDLFGRKKKG